MSAKKKLFLRRERIRGKVDLTTTVGLFICVVCILFGVVQGSDDPTKTLLGFVDGASVLIVVAGGTAAVAVCYPVEVFIGIIQVTKQALNFKPRDTKAILAMLQDMSNRARREGTLALEEFIDKVEAYV